MKKMMLAAMAAMVIGSAGTALAATPGQGYCRDNVPCIEADYTCGGGYHGRGRGGRGGYGGYGCDGYGYGHRSGYCYDNENNEG